MIEIDRDLGDCLLSQWGIDDWKGSDDCKYLMWRGCCVFCYRDDGVIQIHMAMKPRKRHLCHEASKAFIEMFHDRILFAPILKGNNSLINMVKKIGFTMHIENYINDGDVVDIYVRYPNG